jgi:hypothetical protein
MPVPGPKLRNSCWFSLVRSFSHYTDFMIVWSSLQAPGELRIRALLLHLCLPFCLLLGRLLLLLLCLLFCLLLCGCRLLLVPLRLLRSLLNRLLASSSAFFFASSSAVFFAAASSCATAPAASGNCGSSVFQACTRSFNSLAVARGRPSLSTSSPSIFRNHLSD